MSELIRADSAAERPHLDAHVPTRWECSVAAAAGFLRVAGRLASAAPLAGERHNGISALSREQGLVCARESAIELLARAAGTLGSVDRVVRILKLKLVVPDDLRESDRFAVGEAGSEVFLDVLGPARGRHRRVVVPVTTLPEGILMEAEVSMRVGEWGRVTGSAFRR